MWKANDIVICKSFPKIVNGELKSFSPDLTVDKKYKVIRVSNNMYYKNSNLTLQMLVIIGDSNEECYYWSDYFYTKQEMRKIKLKKL